MSIEIYGATRDGVLGYLAAWSATGSVLPGYESIDADGQHVLGAATQVAAALVDGSYGAAAGSSAATTPYAYQALHDLVEKLAAARFAEARPGVYDSEKTDRSFAQVNAELARIRAGGSYHELSATTTRSAGRFYRGDSTSTTHDARRFSADDEL